jgi:ribonuclease PH
MLRIVKSVELAFGATAVLHGVTGLDEAGGRHFHTEQLAKVLWEAGDEAGDAEADDEERQM